MFVLVFLCTVVFTKSKADDTLARRHHQVKRKHHLRGGDTTRQSKPDPPRSSTSSLRPLIPTVVSNGLRQLSMLIPLSEVASEPYLTSSSSLQNYGISSYGRQQLVAGLQEIMRVVDWMCSSLADDEERNIAEDDYEKYDDIYDDDKDDDYSLEETYAFEVYYQTEQDMTAHSSQEEDDDVFNSLKSYGVEKGEAAAWLDFEDDDDFEGDDDFDDDMPAMDDDDEMWYGDSSVTPPVEVESS
ncbi:hypothetical protein EON65_23750 [archaeon]|nr:MAG: hypothetical protein EON65_23750 [archaeon]